MCRVASSNICTCSLVMGEKLPQATRTSGVLPGCVSRRLSLFVGKVYVSGFGDGGGVICCCCCCCGCCDGACFCALCCCCCCTASLSSLLLVVAVEAASAADAGVTRVSVVGAAAGEDNVEPMVYREFYENKMAFIFVYFNFSLFGFEMEFPGSLWYAMSVACCVVCG